jgi:hypothetical protein
MYFVFQKHRAHGAEYDWVIINLNLTVEKLLLVLLVVATFTIFNIYAWFLETGAIVTKMFVRKFIA